MPFGRDAKLIPCIGAPTETARNIQGNIHVCLCFATATPNLFVPCSRPGIEQCEAAVSPALVRPYQLGGPLVEPGFGSSCRTFDTQDEFFSATPRQRHSVCNPRRAGSSSRSSGSAMRAYGGGRSCGVKNMSSFSSTCLTLNNAGAN